MSHRRPQWLVGFLFAPRAGKPGCAGHSTPDGSRVRRQILEYPVPRVASGEPRATVSPRGSPGTGPPLPKLATCSLMPLVPSLPCLPSPTHLSWDQLGSPRRNYCRPNPCLRIRTDTDVPDRNLHETPDYRAHSVAHRHGCLYSRVYTHTRRHTCTHTKHVCAESEQC